jgi:hypothetical protein
MMQQMEEPEERAYSGMYQGNAVDLDYGNRQFSEEYTAENEQPRYQTNEWGQQKLQPISRSVQVQRITAFVLMAVNTTIMATAIPLFVFSVINLATSLSNALPQELSGDFVASFVFSLLMMILSIAAFVTSIIQVSLFVKKRFRRLW